MVEFLNCYGKIKVVIEGYFLVLGVVVYNKDLLLCCVNVLKVVLVKDYGIDMLCLMIVGYGEECLLDIVNIKEVYYVNCCIEVKVSEIIFVFKK